MARSAASKTWVVSIVAIAALTMINLSGCSSSGHSTSGQQQTSNTSPTPSLAANQGMTQTHTSRLLRYEMSYPAIWTLKAATRPWLFGKSGDESGPTVDEYHSPGPQAILVSSQKLPPKMTDQAWRRSYAGNGTPTACWPSLAQWPTTKIAGHTAWLHGAGWCNFIEAVTVVNGRAYVFTGSGGPKCCHRFDQGEFESFLATVRFPDNGTA